MECDFLGGFIPFYLFWPSIINFGVSFNTNAYRRHGKNIAKITGEPKPLRKFIILGQNGSVGAKSWSDDTLLKRPSPLLPLLDRYRDIGDVLDDETVSSDEAGKFNISAQLETSIHDFVHTRGRAKGRVLLCKHKQFNIDNQVAMHKYSLNRTRFNELNKNKATDLEFSATPSQLIHHLTHGYNCRLNYKCIAKLEESKIDNFLELEKERLNSNWKSINLQRKTY
jgi:hypothetical protein